MSDGRPSHDAARTDPATGSDRGRSIEELLPQVYDELRKLARAKLARLAPGQTLQPTALVHEVYVRLLGKPSASWADERQFFLAAARAMHDILVDRARQKGSLKRGGGRRRLDLECLTIAHEAPPQELLALSEALGELEQKDPSKHRIVLLRFFAGCTNEQTADVLEMSLRSVQRHWRFARAWLHQRLCDDVAR